MTEATEATEAQATPIHYLRANEKVWTPPHVVFLDSETRTTMVGDLEILELRLWVAKLVDRRDGRKRSGPVYWARGEDAGSLAAQVAEWARGRKSLWVYAHNLAFDLVTTGLPLVMTRAGWRVTDFALRSEAPWVRLSDGKATVTLCDSWGWLRASLGDVAAAYGAAKEPLPDNTTEGEEWWARCTTDVELLSVVMLELMAWWDAEELGRWTISGAACGWNAFRHRKTYGRVLVDPDPEVLAHDRRAIRGGRRDVTRLGDLGRGDFVEVDFTAAYPTVAAHLPLPRGRGGTFKSLPLDHRAIDDDGWGVLAEVTLTTETPRYPVKANGVTWYPVGTFRTHLAGPEIAWARENGDLVAIGPGRFHQLGWVMQPWAEWVLAVMEGREDGAPVVARFAARNWGRTVIGKWASRSQVKEGPWVSPVEGWGYQEGRDADLGVPGAWVDMAGERWWCAYDTEGENTYPAVLAWVESHVRVRLGRLVESMPPGSWVSCDTDGAMLDMAGAAAWAKGRVKMNRIPRSGWGLAQAICDLVAPTTWPLVPRPKRAHTAMRLMGAQHVITPEDRKLSGVRRDAEETAPWAFKARDWPGLSWQMGHSTPGRYVRPERTPKLARPLAHRWVTEDGECWPVVARLDPAGATELVPWRESWGPHVTTPLAALQYKGLDGLY